MTRNQIIEAMAESMPDGVPYFTARAIAEAAFDAAFPLIQAALADKVREGMERSGFNASVRDDAARLIEGATL